MDGAKKADGGLVIANGNGTVMLPPSKEVLNQIVGLIQMPVIVTLHGTGTDAGSRHRLTCLNEWPHHQNLSVVGLVGNDQIGRRINLAA